VCKSSVLISKTYPVLVLLNATTNGIYGTERARDCHGVLFVGINDGKVHNCIFYNNFNFNVILLITYVYIWLLYTDYYWDSLAYQIAAKSQLL
jgi:hypothetical protein